MSLLDAPKTTFMTNKNKYYYEVVPLEIKNVRDTYPRMMDMVFASQIGQNLEVYVDEMVIKNPRKSETLRRFRRNIRVNQKLQHEA